MHRRYLPLVTVALAILGSSLPDPAAAQWIGYPTAGVPRKADGAVDVAAPAPRLAGRQARSFRNLDRCESQPRDGPRRGTQ